MTLSEPIKSWKLFILVIILIAVAFFAFMAWQFDRSTQQSERHTYSYTIELSYDTAIDNVTFIVPVPERDYRPYFTESLLNKTAYGVPPGWNISLENANGSPMLAIRATRLVPDYHGRPIAIEPGQSPLPTTLVPGHEYSDDTPILMPVTIVVTEKGTSAIETRAPAGREPVFFPAGTFTPGASVTPPGRGSASGHRVPVYIDYTSERPAKISLRVSVTGSNAIWRGGWQSDTYSDSVFIETAGDSKGWIEGEGKLVTSGKASVLS